MKTCKDFIEHAGWRAHPDKSRGVTWDAFCSKCGFELADKPFANGLTIQGDGRTLGFVEPVIIRDGRIYRSNDRYIVCSVCCPQILKGSE